MKPASLRAVAPSSTLLSFLKAQSDSRAFSFCAARSSRLDQSPNFQHASISYAPRRSQSTLSANSPNLSCPATAAPPRPTITPQIAPIQPLCFQRGFGASSKASLWNFLRFKTAKKDDCLTYPRAQSPLPTFLDESDVLRRRLRASNEMRLRCTEFDENGNVTVVNGEFKKTELIQRVSTYHSGSR